jgi:N-glycosylase/DNA lyase
MLTELVWQVNNLCLHYGPLIGYVADQPYHDFPPPEALSGPDVESHLRQLGFGYRAKYLARTATTISEEKPAGWLNSLGNHEKSEDTERDLEILQEGGCSGYRKAHEELLQLQGVGPKVADCVCLMGLGWGEAVPVDTHVWQIAQRDYKFGKGKHKSLTKATYDAVGDHFRSLWGKEAGWAHSVLFAADLRTFAVRLSTKIEVDIEEIATKREDSTILQESIAAKRQIVVEEMFKEKLEDNSPTDSKMRRKRK